MATLKLLSAALLAATVIAAPAMARQHHVTRHSTDSVYAGAEPYAVTQPEAAHGYGANGYRCVPAPRVGAFASQPWDNNVPCEPWTGPAY
jgi:hypothetical protein